MKLIAVFMFVALSAALCQSDDTFKKPIYFEKSIYVLDIVFPDGTKLTSASGIGNLTWDAIQDKPLVYPPATHTHSYLELTDKPGEVELVDALAALGIYLGKTTEELNNIVPANGFGIAKDTTLNVYKVFKNGDWAIVITDR